MLDPHVNFEELLNETDGVAIFSGTVFGFFGNLFEKGKFDEISELYQKLKSKFKNKFYPFDNFQLLRNQQYFSLEYRQIQKWLSGSILRDNI